VARGSKGFVHRQPMFNSRSKTNQSVNFAGGNQGQKKDKSKVKCFFCHKIGHYARDCFAKKKQHANNDDKDGVFSIQDSSVMLTLNQEWIVDSGAAFTSLQIVTISLIYSKSMSR